MPALDFPSSPTNGQTYTSGNVVWTYNSAVGAWKITASGIPGLTGFTGSQGIGFTGSQGTAGPVGPAGSPGNETVITTNTNTVLSTASVFVIASGTVVITLPSAVGIPGLKFNIKNVGNGEVTVATTSSQTIDGDDTRYIIQFRNSVMGVISDGYNWQIF